MDPNIKKILDLTVSQRFETLSAMAKFNDPKAILLLAQEWEFQAKVSTILALKVRADAQLKRGFIDFSCATCAQIAQISDGIYETNHREGHGLRISPQREHPDLHPKKIEVPSWYFEHLGEDRELILKIYESKRTAQINAMQTLGTPIKLPTNDLLQGQQSSWASSNLFNYFPINLNVTRAEAGINKPSREQILQNALCSIIERGSVKRAKLSKEDIVLTIGSCFASEIYVSLVRHGLKAETLRIEESINTTHANLLLLDSIQKLKLHDGLEELLGGDGNIGSRLRYLRDLISLSKIIILTVGVSPIVIDKKTHKIVLSKKLREKFEKDEVLFTYSSVAENCENLIKIVEIIRSIQKDIEIYVTLSPVPLIGVPANQSVLERDVVSKSTIRLAIEEASKRVRFTYWPSFEMVKWLPAHISPEIGYQAFGDPDNNSRHVSRWLVDEITKAFIEHAIELKP